VFNFGLEVGLLNFIFIGILYMSNKVILVVAAHPDDEVLGVGGTLARHVEEGDEVHVLVLCEGISVRYPDAERDFLAEEGQNAAKVLGLSSWTQFGLPDQRIDRLPLIDIISPIEKKIKELKPLTIYTNWHGDINQDHATINKATLIAARCKHRSISEIYAYETPSETEWGIPYNFSPNYFVDISATLEKKLEAMRCYASQSPESPHPRSIEHLRIRAQYWGQCMMMEAAEPLVLLRRYWR
jgi:LmbE family N-acetylglucosaminyl deacetylase